MTGEGALIQINKEFAYLTQDIVLVTTLLSADNLCEQFGSDQNRQSIGPETPDVDRNHLSADNLCKQFGSRSEPTEHVS